MKFNHKSNIWDKYANIWDNFVFKSYFNFIYKTSLKLIKKYLSDYKKILDIGCATGNFLYKTQKINKKLDLYGVDSSLNMIKIAKEKFKNISFYNLKAEEINFPENFFDIITLIETFHHLPNQKLVLEKINKILKPEGIFLIVEPDLNNKIVKILINLMKNFKIEKESTFLKQEELIDLIENFNFKKYQISKSLGSIFLLFKNLKK